MKLKKVLLTILLLAIVATMLLQLNVKAANVTEYTDSEYDYFLTASNKVLTKAELSDTANAEEEIIACIEGEYTGIISSQNADGSLIKISNFTAEELRIEKETSVLWIDGVNEIYNWYCGVVEYQDEEWIIYADLKIYSESNGIIDGGTFGFEVPKGTVYGIECYGGSSAFSGILSLGSYINTMNSTEYDSREINLELGENITAETWQKVEELLSVNIPNFTLAVKDGTVIPASIFKKLSEFENRSICIRSLETWSATTFKSESITNTNASFTTGITTSNNPIGDMVDTKLENVIYIDFKHSGAIPGPITLKWVVADEFENGDIIKCYYFNEETKMYEQVEDAKMVNWDLQLNIDHCSKYVVSNTELPAELVSNDNYDDENIGENNTQTGGETNKEESKQPEQKPSDDKKEEVKQEESKKEDTTTATGKIPYAGGTTAIVMSMVVIAIFGVVAYIKNRELKGI